MLTFRTAGFSGSAVKYSPFIDTRIAVSSSANFGLVGNGRLHVLSLTPHGIVPEKVFDTQDAQFDLCWSEQNENQLVVACGDGSVKLFDTSPKVFDNTPDSFPIRVWTEHGREVFSVYWNLVAKDSFLSSSWDGTVKIWNPAAAESLLTLPIHSCTYSAQFSPHSPSIVSAASSDSHVRLFDLRTPPSAANHLVLSAPVHAASGAMPAECLTHDWNKYRDMTVAVAGVDRTVRVLDLRAPGVPVAELAGHDYAVRKVAWSPHMGDLLLSAGYDMTVRVWSVNGEGGTVTGPRGIMGAHTEFVSGLDWCLFGAEGWVASCGWDEQLLVWDVRGVMK